MWFEVISAALAGCCGGAIAGALIARAATRATSSAARGFSSLKSAQSAADARLDELEAIIRRIDNRDRMRRIRKNASESDAAPNPHTDPSGWKAYMRAQRAQGRDQ